MYKGKWRQNNDYIGAWSLHGYGSYIHGQIHCSFCQKSESSRDCTTWYPYQDLGQGLVPSTELTLYMVRTASSTCRDWNCGEEFHYWVKGKLKAPLREGWDGCVQFRDAHPSNFHTVILCTGKSGSSIYPLSGSSPWLRHHTLCRCTRILHHTHTHMHAHTHTSFCLAAVIQPHVPTPRRGSKT